jgi:hypothetical protein
MSERQSQSLSNQGASKDSQPPVGGIISPAASIQAPASTTKDIAEPQAFQEDLVPEPPTPAPIDPALIPAPPLPPPKPTFQENPVPELLIPARIGPAPVPAPPLPPPIEVRGGSVRAANGVVNADQVASQTNTPQERSFVGGWALSLGDCNKGSGGTAPTIITEEKAEAFGGSCIFHSMQWESDAWKTRATCSVNDKTWIANITLKISGNRLSWSSEKGKISYIRCARP